MDKLMQRGLLQSGLVKLDTPELIGRYNRALEMLGIAPIERDVIHVDGAGWSPQVARERRSNYYLSHGAANPLAVIVCPQQYKMPVYFPMYSWMRPALRQFFEKNYREIADITATHPITIDFEEGLSVFEGPSDLLLLSSISLIPDADGICEAALGQLQLVDAFMQDLNCLSADPLEKLEHSVLANGDLRRRQLCLAPLDYDFFSDFYSVAFEGVGILKNVGGEDLLVLVSESVYESVREQQIPNTHILYVGERDYTPFRILRDNGWLTLPIEKFQADARVLEEKKELLLAWHLLQEAHNDPLIVGHAWVDLRPAQRKVLIQRHRALIPEIYFELERFAARLKVGKQLPELSDELWLYLCEPVPHLHTNTQDVLWILLTRRDPRNLLELYTHDKNNFLDTYYHHWPEAMREWAAEYLVRRYELRHKQP